MLDLSLTRVEVFYLKDHPPVICGWHGGFHDDMYESIEKDLQETVFDKGSGTYLFETCWIEAQIGDEGRVELPGYYDLSLIRFQSVDEL